MNRIINLRLGDCVDVMRSMRSDAVDLTVTSPPYDDLRTYNGSLDDWTPAKWQNVLRELHRITKPGGVVVWIVADASVNGGETGTSFRQALFAKECGFNLHDTMIWNKGMSPSIGAYKSRYLQVFEFMFVFSKGSPKHTNIIRDRENKQRLIPLRPGTPFVVALTPALC